MFEKMNMTSTTVYRLSEKVEVAEEEFQKDKREEGRGWLGAPHQAGSDSKFSKATMILHCKAGEAYASLKNASCETWPGTTLIYSSEICMCSLLIQDFDDGCCFPNSYVTCQSNICTNIV
jgi:hypothetical protein